MGKIINLFKSENDALPNHAICEWSVSGTTIGKLEEIGRYVDEYVPEECRTP